MFFCSLKDNDCTQVPLGLEPINLRWKPELLVFRVWPDVLPVSVVISIRKQIALRKRSPPSFSSFLFEASNGCYVQGVYAALAPSPHASMGAGGGVPAPGCHIIRKHFPGADREGPLAWFPRITVPMGSASSVSLHCGKPVVDVMCRHVTWPHCCESQWKWLGELRVSSLYSLAENCWICMCVIVFILLNINIRF